MWLPTVSRRIRWKLVGFELVVNFSSLQKFREKYFLVQEASYCVLFFSRTPGASNAPVTAIPDVPDLGFGKKGIWMKSEKCLEPRGVIGCVLLTTQKFGIRIWKLSWKTLHEKGYHESAAL
jgi:hypothetical protein